MSFTNYKGHIKDTKRTRGRLYRNVAPCSRLTTNVTGPLHECKKVCPCTESVSTHIYMYIHLYRAIYIYIYEAAMSIGHRLIIILTPQKKLPH